MADDTIEKLILSHDFRYLSDIEKKRALDKFITLIGNAKLEEMMNRDNLIEEMSKTVNRLQNAGYGQHSICDELANICEEYFKSATLKKADAVKDIITLTD